MVVAHFNVSMIIENGFPGNYVMHNNMSISIILFRAMQFQPSQVCQWMFLWVYSKQIMNIHTLYTCKYDHIYNTNYAAVRSANTLNIGSS